ncbi:Uncharacterized protein HZ326_28579, partial [Fusarium oxysporum f. sp. albedinis]
MYLSKFLPIARLTAAVGEGTSLIRHRRVTCASSWLNRSWYAAKSPWRDLAASRWCKAARGSESSGRQRIVALRFNLLYFSGTEVAHHVSKASFGFCLATFRSLSACSLPGMSVWPGIQRTCVAPCDAANAWNSTKTACEESDGEPRRHVAAA